MPPRNAEAQRASQAFEQANPMPRQPMPPNPNMPTTPAAQAQYTQELAAYNQAMMQRNAARNARPTVSPDVARVFNRVANANAGYANSPRMSFDELSRQARDASEYQ